ncbi:MAG TPA: hypothetical protein VFL13_06700 [Candidatus Baltobacteraceae bacterium]|nr:hypothetical protein [Candidatus Baltobacteraceae bacterium]
MSRAQTLVLLAAVVFASLSAVSIGGRPRPVLALLAIALMAVVGYLRLRAAMSRRAPKPSFDAFERAQRIHEARTKRFWR